MISVLVVDTDEAFCDVLKAAIEEEYPESVVICLFSGDRAAQALEDQQVDLAVIEAVLPGVCGFRLAEQAARRGVPVLLMSGELRTQDSLAQFGYPHLCKPFRIGELAAEIQRLTRMSSENLRRLRMAIARRRAAGILLPDQTTASADDHRLPEAAMMDVMAEMGQPIILLVESNERAREILWAGLEDAGYTVIAAASYEEGQVLLAQTRWDMLVTAIDLEGRSGSALAAQARDRGIPVLFVADNFVPLAHRPNAGQAHAPLYPWQPPSGCSPRRPPVGRPERGKRLRSETGSFDTHVGA
ncbi:MAG: response regulator [Acetobacteraceae bacterium]